MNTGPTAPTANKAHQIVHFAGWIGASSWRFGFSVPHIQFFCLLKMVLISKSNVQNTRICFSECSRWLSEVCLMIRLMVTQCWENLYLVGNHLNCVW
jgi:hypothetical protein